VTLITLTSVVGWAKPYVPDDDAVVLERLPEQANPSLKDLKRMRAALAANPRDLDAAIAVARRAIEAARANGDPRFLGQAQAALTPWWDSKEPPPRVRVLRAAIRQSLHDFDGALEDLDALLKADPRAAQARLIRATVLTVLGRYAAAQDDCRALAKLASPLVVYGCLASPASLSGEAQPAYEALLRALAQPGEDLAVREWTLTLAAEIAERRGRAEDAEAHFRAALAFDPADAYLKGVYADFLLAANRPRDALALIGNDLRNDALLLRVVLAEQRLPDRREGFLAHRAEMVARFEAARLRGDNVHRREEARFRLAVEGDVGGSLALARDNWIVQREPADLRILVAAARAANDATTLRLASDWVVTTRLEDKALAAALGRAQ
jgi:tetratricopeptide (TPR) repeat protein